MTDKELMQMALDVMLAAIKAGDWKVDGACDPDYVLEAIRARLSQCDRCGEVNPAEIHTCTPQREWQGLTDEEIKEIIGPWGGAPIKGYTRELIDKIEAKLKGKNG